MMYILNIYIYDIHIIDDMRCIYIYIHIIDDMRHTVQLNMFQLSEHMNIRHLSLKLKIYFLFLSRFSSQVVSIILF